MKYSRFLVMISYEREQERLQRLFDEIISESEPEPEDDDDSLADDNLEELDYTTNSESDFSEMDNFEESFSQIRKSRNPLLVGKDGTKWRKHCEIKRNVRTRSENICLHLPGPKGEIRKQSSGKNIWEYFLTNKIPRRKFLENLGFELLSDHIRRRAQQKNISRTIRLRLTEICGLKESNQNNQNQSYGRCTFCDSKKNRKTRFTCVQCAKHMCLEHLTGLCSDCCHYDTEDF